MSQLWSSDRRKIPDYRWRTSELDDRTATETFLMVTPSDLCLVTNDFLWPTVVFPSLHTNSLNIIDCTASTPMVSHRAAVYSVLNKKNVCLPQKNHHQSHQWNNNSITFWISTKKVAKHFLFIVLLADPSIFLRFAAFEGSTERKINDPEWRLCNFCRESPMKIHKADHNFEVFSDFPFSHVTYGKVQCRLYPLRLRLVLKSMLCQLETPS